MAPDPDRKHVVIGGCPGAATAKLARLLGAHPSAVIGLGRYAARVRNGAALEPAMFERDAFFALREDDAPDLIERHRAYYDAARKKHGQAVVLGDDLGVLLQQHYATLSAGIPAARVVYLLRNPVGAVRSGMKRAAKAALPDDDVIATLVTQWNASVRDALKAIERGAKVTVMQSEDLAGSPEPLLGLLSELGLPAQGPMQRQIEAGAKHFGEDKDASEPTLSPSDLREVLMRADLDAYRALIGKDGFRPGSRSAAERKGRQQSAAAKRGGPPPLTLVASYPKSGATWFRFLVYGIYRGKIERSAEVARFYLEIIQAEQVQKKIDGGTAPIFVKGHYPYFAGHPFLDSVSSCIYIARHPLECMTSRLNHYVLHGNAELLEPERMKQFYVQFINSADLGSGEIRPRRRDGGWNNHVISWLGGGVTFPVHLLKYEEMRKTPVEALMALSERAGYGWRQSDVLFAVEQASQENMQRIEDHEIKEKIRGMFYNEHNDRDGSRFVGSSLSKELRAGISDDIVRLAREKFAAGCKLLGYAL